MLGSSRMYNTPISDEPICVASLILWLSPPESVPLERFNVKYSRPTLFKKANLSQISLITGLAIICSLVENSKFLKNSKLSTILKSQTSKMFIPPTVTAKASRFNRLPLQSGQWCSRITLSISRFEYSLCVSLYLLLRLFIMPSNGATYLPPPHSVLRVILNFSPFVP